jgi:hypothetical protein
MCIVPRPLQCATAPIYSVILPITCAVTPKFTVSFTFSIHQYPKYKVKYVYLWDEESGFLEGVYSFRNLHLIHIGVLPLKEIHKNKNLDKLDF